MKALILNNKVVDLVENEFPVHSSLTWVDCDDTVETGMTYDGSSFSKPTITLEMHMSAIRSKRNFLLSETDWYGNSDVTMSADMTTYRQNLRDITNGIDTIEKANNITWPTKP